MVTKSELDFIQVNNKDHDLNRTRFRLATPDEIEEYKLNQNISKYNV